MFGWYWNAGAYSANITICRFSNNCWPKLTMLAIHKVFLYCGPKPIRNLFYPTQPIPPMDPYAHAMIGHDGSIEGTIAFPTEFGELFAPTLYSDMQKFPTFNFVTRVQPSTTIGDMNLAGLVYSREEENGINWFVSGGWTQMPFGAPLTWPGHRSRAV